ncbi:hypothetical protein [Rathayibacter caricis]
MMGRLLYGTPPSAHPFDDRALAHLQLVITAKLRRSEAFVLSIDADADGRHSELWLHPAIPLQYEYDAPVGPEVNAHWLRELSAAANGRRGLHLVTEPTTELDPSRARAVQT